MLAVILVSDFFSRPIQVNVFSSFCSGSGAGVIHFLCLLTVVFVATSASAQRFVYCDQ